MMPGEPLSEVRDLPIPPRLHWGWVLMLTVFTGGLFGAFWLLVQARWSRRVRGMSNAYGWAVVLLCVVALSAAGSGSQMLFGDSASDAQIVNSLDTASFVLYYVVVFLLEGELEEPPLGMPLSGAMTFFFGPVYFQYRLSDLTRERQQSGGNLGLL